MTKFHWLLLMLYLTLAAGYGGWRGPDLWSDWGVWCLLIPPFVWAALKAIGMWRRNPYWVSIKIGLAMTVVAVVAIGGQALLLAWVAAEATTRWSADPVVRAITAVGLLAAVAALVWAAKAFEKRAQSRPATGSGNTDDPMGPAIEPDHTT
jgi:hypothetical protein